MKDLTEAADKNIDNLLQYYVWELEISMNLRFPCATMQVRTPQYVVPYQP